MDRLLKRFGASIPAIVAALAALPYLRSREADATMAAPSAVATRERVTPARDRRGRRLDNAALAPSIRLC